MVTEEAGFFKVVFWRRNNGAVDVVDNQKMNTESSKMNIESSIRTDESSRRTIIINPEEMQEFSSTTRKNIEQIAEKLGVSEYFYRQMVVEVLGLKQVAAHYLLKKMLVKGIIETVLGHGKGAYRFVYSGMSL